MLRAASFPRLRVFPLARCGAPALLARRRSSGLPAARAAEVPDFPDFLFRLVRGEGDRMDSAKELLRLWDADRTELAALRASKAEKEALLRTLERVVEEEERVVQEKERIVEKTERIIEEKEHIVQEKERIVEKTERIIEESAFLHTMARCSGQQAAVSRAIESGNAGALEKLARSEAQSMVDLYSYLCEGIHNPRGVHFLPIARGDRTRACQLRALADKFNVEAREVDSADVGFEKLYAPVPGDPADSDK